MGLPPEFKSPIGKMTCPKGCRCIHKLVQAQHYVKGRCLLPITTALKNHQKAINFYYGSEDKKIDHVITNHLQIFRNIQQHVGFEKASVAFILRKPRSQRLLKQKHM